jgi:hypothetical protein
MDNRINQIIITELANKKMVFEERLENTINSNMDIEDKTKMVLECLKKIVLFETMFIKWGNITTPKVNDNLEDKKD